MKVLLINTYDANGGAARSALRLLAALKKAEIKAAMLVQEKTLGDEAVICPYPEAYAKRMGKIRCKLDLQPLYRLHPHRERVPFSLHWLPGRLVSKANGTAPDIVNLHWVSAGFLRVESLTKFRAPLVWTLHDMWPFTGGCHHSGDCTRFRDKCGCCPVLKSARECDLSRWIWRRKEKSWRAVPFAVVAPSRWLADKARQSSLFSGRSIDVIPNGLDTDVFSPVSKCEARDRLNLARDETILLTGGINILTDRGKGFHLLQDSLCRLREVRDLSNTRLLVFGADEPKRPLDLPLKTSFLGILNDDCKLALAYAAADLFLAPSLYDNLPNTVMESLACGTPVAAFSVGGIPDLVEHRRNGYLAAPFDTEQLASGIYWILQEESRCGDLARFGRKKAEEDYSLEVLARRYMKLYERLIAEQNPI